MSRLSRADWPGYQPLMDRIGRMASIDYQDAKPLLEECERVFVEDNRKGVLAGTQGDGSGMPRVTYRGGSAGKTTYARRGQSFGAASGTFKGRKFGGVAQGNPHANGNLTTAEYRKLTGPPLAPRGANSRVITNFVTSSGQDGQGRFFVKRGWKQVVSAKGRPILPPHFKGLGRLPKRDLRGLRPWGQQKVKEATRTWLRYIVKGK